MSGLSTRITRIYDFLRNNSSFFGKSIGKHTIISINEAVATFTLQIQPEVCISNRMPCSTAIAIFDELSTIGFMVLDKQHRPGVSVQISARILKPVNAGETLTLEVNYDKLGRTIAFASMVMKNEANVIVASGRHVKYLPISWFYDNVLAHPCIFQILTSALYDDENNCPTTWIGMPIFRSMLKSDVAFDIKSDKSSQISGNIFDSINFDGNLQPNFKVRRNLCNPFGMLHGGAAAIATESAIRQKRIGHRVLQLDLSFFSSIAVGRGVNVVLDDSSEKDLDGSLVSGEKVAVKFSAVLEKN
jgi:acyl-coenzyme A thioesterase 13